MFFGWQHLKKVSTVSEEEKLAKISFLPFDFSKD